MFMGPTITRNCGNLRECFALNAARRNRRMVREAKLTEHSHHMEGSAGGECIECYMPKIETMLGTTMVRAHTFAFISPSDTEKYKIPNACTDCHKDKTTKWTSDALRSWPPRSPWRVNQSSAP